MAVGTKPGYQIGRDSHGLTERERQVLVKIVEGLQGPQIAVALGITKQRVDQIQKSLVRKGALEKLAHEYRVTVTRG